MVVLNKIYTRTGDDGTTALGSGRRVAKYDLRVEAYGTLDETNAAIGLARLHTPGGHPALDASPRCRSNHIENPAGRYAVTALAGRDLDPEKPDLEPGGRALYRMRA